MLVVIRRANTLKRPRTSHGVRVVVGIGAATDDKVAAREKHVQSMLRRVQCSMKESHTFTPRVHPYVGH